MREQQRSDQAQPSRPVLPDFGEGRESNHAHDTQRKLDALAGDVENPRIWRGID